MENTCSYAGFDLLARRFRRNSCETAAFFPENSDFGKICLKCLQFCRYLLPIGHSSRKSLHICTIIR
jgi:hypothetical protein